MYLPRPRVSETSSDVVAWRMVFEAEPESETLLMRLASSIEAEMTPGEIEEANLAISNAVTVR